MTFSIFILIRSWNEMGDWANGCGYIDERQRTGLNRVYRISIKCLMHIAHIRVINLYMQMDRVENSRTPRMHSILNNRTIIRCMTISKKVNFSASHTHTHYSIFDIRHSAYANICIYYYVYIYIKLRNLWMRFIKYNRNGFEPLCATQYNTPSHADELHRVSLHWEIESNNFCLQCNCTNIDADGEVRLRRGRRIRHSPIIVIASICIRRSSHISSTRTFLNLKISPAKRHQWQC